ncbi:MAG: SpoIIE family protein phosphatase [Pyrinomonadaceae bacterium MAG19_C2-C3]|nr:SpoIIE family protein phosphatase [Pyrinomonadaceae bacterium MAG19_C2-C3]
MPSLIIKHPGYKPEAFPLRQLRITIGRSARNDVCLPDPFASRVHAEVRFEGDRYVLQDLGSANGTYYESRQINDTQPLAPGATLRVGETEIEFLADDSIVAITSPNKALTGIGVAADAGSSVAPGGNTTSGLLEAIENARRAQPSGRDRGSVVAAKKQLKPNAESNAELATSAREKSDLLALIGKVGVTLLASATLDETLRQIVSLVFDAVPAERCMIMLRRKHDTNGNTNGDETPRSVTHDSLEVRAAAQRGTTRGTIEPPSTPIKVSRAILDETVTRGRSVLTSDAQHDPRFMNSTVSIEGIRSVIAVPLQAGNAVLGIVYADSPIATTNFTEEHLEVLKTLASVAAIRVENARLLEEQLDRERLEREIYLAREIQQRFQPATPPQVEGYDLIGISFSCYEIGGDYYDFIRRPDDKLIITLGDVSGKGTAAALLMSSLHAAIHAQACVQTSLTQTISAVNLYLAENIPSNRFVTLFYSELDAESGTLDYLNAGHNPPLLVRRPTHEGEAKAHEQLDAGGIPLGISPDAQYEEQTTHLNAGDVLVIYSDGVSETADSEGTEFGIERLRETITANMDLTAAALRDRIESALTKFAGGTRTADDVTLIIVKRNQ